MPFSGYRQPSLALGILKSVLRPLVSHVTVLDATLIFAEMISPTVYDTIATWPAQDLLGDWVFAHARSPEPGQEDRGYEQQVLAGGAPEHRVAHFGKPRCRLAYTLNCETPGVESTISCRFALTRSHDPSRTSSGSRPCSISSRHLLP